MYLRKIRPRGRGKSQVYWELVESYRTAKGSRQRTVAYLGKLSRNQLSAREKLTGQVTGRLPLPSGTSLSPLFAARAVYALTDAADVLRLA